MLDYKTDRVRKGGGTAGKISCAAGLLCGGFGTAFKETGQREDHLFLYAAGEIRC